MRRWLGESPVVERYLYLSPVAGLVADEVAEAYDSRGLGGVVNALRGVHIDRGLRIALHKTVVPVSY